MYLSSSKDNILSRLQYGDVNKAKQRWYNDGERGREMRPQEANNVQCYDHKTTWNDNMSSDPRFPLKTLML